MTNAGITVLLTRSADENERSRIPFEALGLNVQTLPGIERADPGDWTEVDASIRVLETYDGILFSSHTAVTAFVRRVREIRPDGLTSLNDLTVAAVGERTAEALDEAGIAVTVMPEIASAEDLASSLDTTLVAGKRFLFPCSDIARNVLPDALRTLGATVDVRVVYRTLPPSAKALDHIRAGLSDGTIRVIAFFSPSAVRNVVQLLGTKCLEATDVAVIGPTTAAAVRQVGLEPSIMPAERSAASMAEAIAEYRYDG